jgi:hypothetical protein
MSPEPSAPEYVERRLTQAVAEHHGLGELEVDFRVERRVVVVSGNLSSEEHRATLHDVIAEICPGYEVQDLTGLARSPGEHA